MREAFNLSTDVLEWAARQVGSSVEDIAGKVAKRDRDRESITSGQLTSSQAEKFSKLTGIPFGLLFMPGPPELNKASIPDLRQTHNPVNLGRDFQDVLEDVVRKHEWFIEHLRLNGAEELPFVGKFKGAKFSQAVKIAEDLKETLEIDDSLRKNSTNSDEYFSVLAARAERAGILVLKSGIVKSNTRRPLSVQEFRGFAISDKLAPLVFVNGRDAAVASVFTLLHEIAHIWIGSTGVSDLGTVDPEGTEKICNAVAAEILVPVDSFRNKWEEDDDISRLSKYFRVSRLVIARRALDLSLIDRKEYSAIARQPPPPKKESNGGDPYKTIPTRNSKRLTRALVRSAMSGETMIRDAASLLAVKTQTILELGRRDTKNG